MDPVSAFSLAGTIVQFIDFTTKLVISGHELYKAGELSIHEMAALATNDLLDLSLKLNHPFDPPSESVPLSKDEEDLRDLSSACTKMVGELYHRLDKLKVHDKHNIGKSLRKAFRSMWERKDLKDMEERLSKVRSAIDTRILVSLR
jgi:hypothetical protein